MQRQLQPSALLLHCCLSHVQPRRLMRNVATLVHFLRLTHGQLSKRARQFPKTECVPRCSLAFFRRSKIPHKVCSHLMHYYPLVMWHLQLHQVCVPKKALLKMDSCLKRMVGSQPEHCRLVRQLPRVVCAIPKVHLSGSS